MNVLKLAMKDSERTYKNLIERHGKTYYSEHTPFFRVKMLWGNLSCNGH